MQRPSVITKADFDGYLAWHNTLSYAKASEIAKSLLPPLKIRMDEPHLEEARHNAFEPVYGCGTNEERWEKQKPAYQQTVRDFARYAEQYNQPLLVGNWSDQFAYLHLGNPQQGILVYEPTKWLEYQEAPDYSAKTLPDVKAMLNASNSIGTDLIPAEQAQSLTVRDLQQTLHQQEDTISNLKQAINDTKDAKTGELAELKAQIDHMMAELEAKKEAMLAELNEKKAQMEEMKWQMENQIYLLDSQIYSICCYAGETIRFAQLRKGNNASDAEPVVIYQKLRFLDEDLARLASLYAIDWDDLKMFEDFLKYSPLAEDTFFPNPRCVVLVRLSRDGKTFGKANLQDGNPWHNMLDSYSYYHGKTVGIIIRNGENIWLGWTEEERVHIDDDLILSKPVVTEVKPAEEPTFHFESDKQAYIKQQRNDKRRLVDGIVSRNFVYNILQGVVDRGDMLPLPSGTKLSQQSEYVIYSVADKCLTDNRFESWADIIDRCNEHISVGNMLLTCQHLVPEHYDSYGRHTWGQRAWDNSRGRGERNRTHDCQIEDCTLYPANVVEYDEPIPMVRYQYNGNVYTTEADGQLGKNSKVLEYYDSVQRHVYVSVKKTDNWYYQSDARANMEVYDDEVINLAYMNSVWLEWVITTQNLGGWTIGGKQVNYAHAIRYLKTALDFVRKREIQERTFIEDVDKSACEDADWPVKLSEWKLEKQVWNITPYQAKRFVKWVKSHNELTNIILEDKNT